ncbi:T9SS type B sorting domain-containing protein [Flavobacterium croceum]|uniref:T9SS type B sorting domain-containing protein n=1 Tax=Flavobacterium croceum TaxID=370975 RepID=UPI0024A87AA8|nr:T9SS type B sorting domain-containing protein [Flavobacterium croceum]
MKKYLIFNFVFLLFNHLGNAQFSKTHYIPPISNAISLQPQNQFIYVSCPSITPIAVEIKEIGGTTFTGTVSRDNPLVYDIGFGQNTQLMVSDSNAGSVYNNKGYIVQASDLIYVTVRLVATPQRYQAGGLVSKGIASLGKQFRVGAMVNTLIASTSSIHYTFASILATENNTTVSFSDIKPGVTIKNLESFGNSIPNITLNAGESYVLAVDCSDSNANRDGLIGALIAADKNIVVNCGSFAGSNGNASNIDLGFDQIVSTDRIGNQYIFIKGNGVDVVEKPLIVAHENNTAVYLNGNTTPTATLNAGEYLALNGANFTTNNNLYVSTSKNVFAYQGIGGSNNQANQNMHFLPPLSCQTPKIIDNIPYINSVGNDDSFTGTVCIVTETGATLNFILNGTTYPITGLPAGIVANGPFPVTGNPNYVTYSFEGLTGNISVLADKQVYLSYFGTSGAATYGGFYSGFTFKPEVAFQTVDITQTNCIPNVNLNISSVSGFDTYQWYKDGAIMPGETTATLHPTQPGLYKVRATLTSCNIDLYSDEIPVSKCPTDTDNDGVNDNIDLDWDNDGITNCNESLGDTVINISNPTAGTIVNSTYTNTFTANVTTSTTASPTPFVGATDGSFVTHIPAGKGYFVQYTSTFTNPLALGIEYVSSANSTDLLNANAEYEISVPTSTTITVLNPNNQLLIDTNYDGIYESGVTEYSSFNIRFRLNSTTSLAAGTGTFKFLTKNVTSITILHRNLTDQLDNKSTFKLYAVCVPKNSDNDTIPDAEDYDSDNDGIPDIIEATGTNAIVPVGTDSNHNGIDDAFGNGIAPQDFDNDGIPNYLDLDADNDGIFDAVEAGNTLNATSITGISSGPNYGTNGLDNNLETATDSNIVNYTIADTDNDGIYNFLELDSDNDACFDVVEAGFTDVNQNGYADTTSTTINSNGTVPTTSGYTLPNSNYIIAAPISITTQPINVTVCELENATFTVASSNSIDSYQWQISTDNGLTYTNITNNATYSGATTASLQITSVTPAMTNYKYRVFLNRNGNSCGKYSQDAMLTTYALPVVNTPVTLKQCDDNTDGISVFNLTQINPQIAANYTNYQFSYFTTFAGADTNDINTKITNETSYTTGDTTLYVRVVTANNCKKIVTLQLLVSVSQIPNTYHKTLTKCDDYIDATQNNYDGVASFSFAPLLSEIAAMMPNSNYTVTFYPTLLDAQTETNEITNTTNFRNTTSPNTQNIWVRIDSTIDNSCYAMKDYLTLVVEPTPVIHSVGVNNTIRKCDDNTDGVYAFDTSTLSNQILGGQTHVDVSYYDNGTLLNPLPNPYTVTTSKTLTVRLTNNPSVASDGPCYVEGTITFIVDKVPFAQTIPASTYALCDNEDNPLLQNGILTFNTATLQSTILAGQTDMQISYINSATGATIASPFPPTFTTSTTTIIARVFNPLNPNCYVETTVYFTVLPIPRIDLNTNGNDDEIVCTNLSATSPIYINAEVQNANLINTYTYQWYQDGIQITGATHYTLQVTTGGNYSVVVTTSAGCSRTRTVKVTASQIATIEQIIIKDLSENNSIEVITSGNGVYVYALDDINGNYQTSNLITPVDMGIHTLYVKDINGCGIVPKEVYVLGAPAYFTPNGDGYNDYWNLKGLEPNKYPKAEIQIFDRYGKLLKQFSPYKTGWDGYYNNQQLPADDYWYVIKLNDYRTAKGHFSIKR